MANLLKLVCLGGSVQEAVYFMKAQAEFFGGVEIHKGKVGGVEVLRFEAIFVSERERQPFSLFSLAEVPDFRGVYQLLLANAHGAIALIPADVSRIPDAREVVIPLYQMMEERRKEDEELPVIVQYHWDGQGSAPSAEGLDRALGVNPQLVERVFTRADSDSSAQVAGTLALLKKAVDEGESASL